MSVIGRIYAENRVQVATAAVVLILSFLWFYYPGRYVLIANQDTSLFLVTIEYLTPFLKHPGGVLEYAGSFLGQLQRFPLPGALLLSAMGTSICLLAMRLLRGTMPPAVRVTAGVLAAAMAVAMHNYYPHCVTYTLGFITAMILAISVPGGRRDRLIFMIPVVPLLYYCCGGYLWFFLILWFSIRFSKGEKPDWQALILGILYPLMVFLSGVVLLFLLPWMDLALNPLPVGPAYGPAPWPLIFTAYLFLLPLTSPLLARLSASRTFLRGLRGIPVYLAAAAVVFLLLRFSYNRKNAEFYTLESFALREDWSGLLRYAGDHPSTNLFGTFYTNLALVNHGRLCSDLFNYPQPFGRRSLCFGWEAKGEVLRRGSDFFWTIGFVNEAHHWAYESMIVDGLTRRNLERLVQCELVRGNFGVAGKYIGWMRKSLFGGPLFRHYRPLLEDPGSIVSDPELGPRATLAVQKDFFADGGDLEKNLKALLVSEPACRPVMDYLMALYLLEGRIGEIVALLPAYLQCCRGPLPVLLEEALLVHKITQREDNRTNVGVSEQTIRRFDEYTRVLRGAGSREEAARKLYPGFGNSFWFYLNFTLSSSS